MTDTREFPFTVQASKMSGLAKAVLNQAIESGKGVLPDEDGHIAIVYYDSVIVGAFYPSELVNQLTSEPGFTLYFPPMVGTGFLK